MRIIPAIDIIGGKCVRLSRGDYDTKKVYSEDPLEVARAFEAHGIEYLHLVDLDGAKSAHIVNHGILEAIATGTGLRIDFGGGLKTDDDLRIAFECGATQVTGGSIAVKDRATFSGWISRYGPEKIILGADALDEKIAVNGWQEQSGEDLVAFIASYRKLGISYVICTDISKDGMLEGPSLGLYRKILESETHNGLKATGLGQSSLNLIASGGVARYEDLEALRNLGCEAAILGKAIYEQRISLKEIEKFVISS